MEGAKKGQDSRPEIPPPAQPNPLLTKDGKPRKKRGRPPKNATTAASPEAVPSFTNEHRVSARRGRPPKNKVQQTDYPDDQEHAPKKPTDASNSNNEQPQSMGTMDFIRQQQEQAQALAQNYGSILASPVARSMIQAHALGQPMPPGIGLPLTGKISTAQGTSSAFRPTQPVGAGAGAVTAMGIPTQTTTNTANNSHHGKTAITTQTATNQHPQQGTVAPHWEGITHTMSPRTMSVLLKGSTAVAEDMALSSLPLAAGGGVLTGATFTGPVATPAVPDNNSKAQSVAAGIGKPAPSKQQGKSDESSQQPQKNSKSASSSSSKRKGAGVVKRKGTGAATDSAETRPSVSISDDNSDRLVNPLLDLPPPILPAHFHNRHRSSIVSVGGAGGEGSAAEAPPRNVLQASELQAWAAIVYGRPDTYSIAQYARWLGFNVPAAQDVKDIPKQNYVPPDSTDVPFEIAKDPTLKHIPPEGQFADQVWKATYSKFDDENGDAALEGCIDPLYKTLLAGSEEWTTIPGKPSNSKSPFKSALYHQSVKFKASTPSPDRIEQILQQAQNYGILKADSWSVVHVSRSSIASATAATLGSTADPSLGNAASAATNAQAAGTSVLENLPEAKKGPKAQSAQGKGKAPTTAKSAGEAATGTGSLPASAEVTKPPSGRDNNTMWGFAAWHKGRGVNEPDLSMVLHYQFQWYYLISKCSREQKIAELVMRVPYGPQPVTPGNPNVATPPSVEKDCFADEFSKTPGSADGLLPERKRLIIILYALVLEHARQCDVCYCLLQIPPSLVPMMQEFFRMTPVPLQKKPSPAGSATTAATTTFTPMLCDVHKCSTKYALLIQKEMLRNKIAPIPRATTSQPPLKHRVLVRLPTTGELNAALLNPGDLHMSPNGIALKSKRQRKDAQNGERNGNMFRSAPGAARQAYLRLRARIKEEGKTAADTGNPSVETESREKMDDQKTPSQSDSGPPMAASNGSGSTAPETGGSKEKEGGNSTGAEGTDATKQEGGSPDQASATLVPEHTAAETSVKQSESTNVPVKQSESTNVPVNGIRKDQNMPIPNEETGPASAATSQSKDVASNESAPPIPPGESQASTTATDSALVDSEANSSVSAAKFSFEMEGRNREGLVIKAGAVATPAYAQSLSWDLVKSFPVVAKDPQGEKRDVTLATAAAESKGDPQTLSDIAGEKGTNGVLWQLKLLQEKLAKHETDCLEPKVRSLLKLVVEERREFEASDFSKKQKAQKEILDTSEKMLARRRELDEAWQAQCDQDMDAVCEICNDGEVTPTNQILFCEACNVAVHQGCYGIERVPEGDYYCLACQHFGRRKVDRDVERRRLYRAAAAAEAAGETDIATIVQQVPQEKIFPASCQLCPIRSGAFVPTDNYKRRYRMRMMQENGGRNQSNSTAEKENDDSTWVHMVCAKWQGLNFVEQAKPGLLIEDVTELKAQYRSLGYHCCLCLGERGAFHECRFEGCENRLHVMCARSSGLCDVIHGEDVKGTVKSNGWSLLCPAHSNRPFLAQDKLPPNLIPVQKLVLMAKSFPPEPKPDPRLLYANKWPDNPFNKLTGQERREALANPKYEQHLMVELSKKLLGVRCEVCDQWEEDGKSLTRCRTCGIVFCDSCHVEGDGVSIENRQKFRCAKCTWQADMKKQKQEAEEPHCVVCNMKGGWLRPAVANPISKKDYWSKNHKKREKTLFRRPIWVHTLCAMWCAPSRIPIDAQTGTADLSQLVMSDGRGFVKAKDACFLCGKTRGLKEPCANEDCHCADVGNHNMPYFHPTCARQAGLEVKDDSSRDEIFYVKCYRHGGNEFNLRVRIEDLLEIETKRAGKGFAKKDELMTFSDASRIFNASILVMRILGWAWRWAEWWVEYGSNWEPLLEPGQVESKMTKEEKKIVDSTQASRREDARRCRLAAFGAALRNRAYDVEDNGDPDYMGGFDHKSLEQALRAVLSTRSLVGPLEAFEIDFLVDSLGRAYRSKSRLLGFGDDKVEIGKAGLFCQHKKDESPKYVLGGRPLPGKQALRGGKIFEDKVDEVDDFDFYIDVVKRNEEEHKEKAKEQAKTAKAATKKKAEPAPKKRGPGRPPKTRPEGESSPPPKRGPGRPPTKNRPEAESMPTPKRGPGRPPKNRAPIEAPEPEVPSKPYTGRRRGRPPKNRPVVPDPDETPSNQASSDAEAEEVSTSAPTFSNRTNTEPLRNRIERKRTKKRRRMSGDETASNTEAENEPKPPTEEADNDVSGLKEENPAKTTDAAENQSTNGSEAALDATAKDVPETVASPVKRGPGRPPKKKAKLSADPNAEARPKKRRRVLGGTPVTDRPVTPDASSEPTVLYDTIKHRSRRKSQIMSLEQTTGKSYDTAEDASRANDEAGSSSDDDGDVPIAAVVARVRKEAEPESAGPRKESTGGTAGSVDTKKEGTGGSELEIVGPKKDDTDSTEPVISEDQKKDDTESQDTAQKQKAEEADATAEPTQTSNATPAANKSGAGAGAGAGTGPDATMAAASSDAPTAMDIDAPTHDCSNPTTKTSSPPKSAALDASEPAAALGAASAEPDVPKTSPPVSEVDGPATNPSATATDAVSNDTPALDPTKSVDKSAPRADSKTEDPVPTPHSVAALGGSVAAVGDSELDATNGKVAPASGADTASPAVPQSDPPNAATTRDATPAAEADSSNKTGRKADAPEENKNAARSADSTNANPPPVEVEVKTDDPADLEDSVFADADEHMSQTPVKDEGLTAGATAEQKERPTTVLEAGTSRDPPGSRASDANIECDVAQREAADVDIETSAQAEERLQTPVVKMEPDVARVDPAPAASVKVGETAQQQQQQASVEPEEPEEECIEERMDTFENFCQHSSNSKRKRARLRGKWIVAKHWPDKTK